MSHRGQFQFATGRPQCSQQSLQHCRKGAFFFFYQFLKVQDINSCMMNWSCKPNIDFVFSSTSALKKKKCFGVTWPSGHCDCDQLCRVRSLCVVNVKKVTALSHSAKSVCLSGFSDTGTCLCSPSLCLPLTGLVCWVKEPGQANPRTTMFCFCSPRTPYINA